MRTPCRTRRRHDHPLHRSAPAARGDLAAGVRGSRPGWPRTVAAGREPGDAGPQTCPPPRRARGIDGIDDPVAREQVATLDANCKRFGIEQFEMTDVRQGIVHVIGPEQGGDAAGHHHRLRRFPHLHARRLRGAGARHRHVRSGACAGDSVSCAAQEPQHAHRSGGRARPGCRRQGSDPGRHSRHRHTPGPRATPSSTPAAPCGECPWKRA